MTRMIDGKPIIQTHNRRVFVANFKSKYFSKDINSLILNRDFLMMSLLLIIMGSSNNITCAFWFLATDQKL
jgi:hypothetical protein